MTTTAFVLEGKPRLVSKIKTHFLGLKNNILNLSFFISACSISNSVIFRAWPEINVS